MSLKKNDRVMYAGKFIGTLIENPYRDICKNERYVEVLFDGQEGILHIQVNKLKKIIDKNKLHKLELYENTDTDAMLLKLIEEVQEVDQAILNNDRENLIEELLDVMQCCIGIAHTQNINLYDYVGKHNDKLLSRNHKFID